MRLLVAADIHAPYHEWVVDRARPLARAIGGSVDVGYVGEKTPAHEKKLDQILELFDEGQRGAGRLEEGAAAEVLIEWSKEYDGLILGPREPNAIERVLRGSVVVKVLRSTHAPVLVPRKREHPDAPWRLLVGIDVDGKLSGKVCRMAAEWAEHLGGTLDAMYATSEPLPVYHDAKLRARARLEWDAARESERSKLQTILESNAPMVNAGKALIHPGEPEDALADLSSGYDLVVVGNRNREGLMRFLYGPVSSAVVRKADCDVLTLPTAQFDV